MIGQHRQRGPAFGITEHVHVIQDQHHRRRHRRKSRPQPGDDRARHRARGGSKRIEYPPADRLDRIERFRDVAEQDFRVVVCFVDRYPRERLTVTLGPLRQQRRLAVAGRRDHRNDRARAGPRQTFDQGRTAHRLGPDQRAMELGRDKVERRPARTLGPAVPLTHVALAHDPPVPPNGLPLHNLPEPLIRSMRATTRRARLIHSKRCMTDTGPAGKPEVTAVFGPIGGMALALPRGGITPWAASGGGWARCGFPADGRSGHGREDGGCRVRKPCRANIR